MMDYKMCEAFFAKRKDKTQQERKFSHNQWIGFKGTDYWHRHHNTETVLIHADDTYTLYTDGWDTVTTWQKIREFVNLNFVWNIPKSIVERRWLSMQDGTLTPFYEGVQVTQSGLVVSERRPYHKQVLIPGVMEEFNEVVRAVRSKVGGSLYCAVALQHGTQLPKQWSAANLWELMELIVESEGIPEDALALFVQREPALFGRPRRRYGADLTPPKVRTPQQCLESSIEAARRHWVTNSGIEPYQAVKCTEPITSFKRRKA